jgi:cobalt/nickel transport system permease protein
MTAILAIQAFVFQDGGIVVLGANVLNMAIAGVVAGYLPYRALAATRYRTLGIFLGATLSVLASAFLALGELLLSGVPMPAAVVGVSAALFIVSAGLEGAITVTVVQAIERLHPSWVRAAVPMRSSAYALLAVGAVLLAGVGVLFASQSPDGLEQFSEKIGIAAQAKVLLATPLADYELHGFSSPWLRRAAAGLAGVAVIWLLCIAIGRLLSRRAAAESA